MKKIVFASVAMAALTVPAIAIAQTTAAPAAAPATAPAAMPAAAPVVTTTTTTAPAAAAPAMTAPAATTMAPAAAPATITTTTTTTPAAMTAEKKVELKDGSWAKVAADGTATVSNDGGKTWTPAPDGDWVSKDGLTTLHIKGGKSM